MEDLRCFTVHFFYEIKDAEIFGGKGTTGYTEMKYDKGTKVDGFISNESYMEHSRTNAKILADHLKVPTEKITSIHRDVYQANTADDDDSEG